jgi:dynein regulatory complex protein 1
MSSAAPQGEAHKSTDKEERKKMRRQRVQKSANKSETIIDGVASTKTSAKAGQQQAVDSLFHLDKRKHTGLKDVTSVRIKTNDSEAKRRIEDDELRRGRLLKLQQEALASAKANAAIEMKWAELLDRDIPQELHQEIQLQMDACNTIIQSKDELIANFQMQLRGKDEEYVRTVRKQGEDIDQLLARIRQEFRELQTEYETEFEAIDDAYTEERERLITDFTSEIDGIFEHRRDKEVYYKEQKQQNEENYQQEIDELITNGADQYNKLKIELEMNIQALKQQLEEIRATYQLNTEKLDYNYRVLTELEIEKNAELTRYKRRLNKLKGQLNILVAKFTEMETSDSKTNNELTENYRSLTLKYKDLQAKFRHFEIADTTKYEESKTSWTSC